MTGWTTGLARPDDPAAAVLLREYMAEMVRRWYGRPERPGEVDAALAEMPSDDLAPPTGLLVLAHHHGRPAGCAGLRWRPGWAELTRVYVRAGPPGRRRRRRPARRRRGVRGRAGADRIRLDTRADLVEARALYARHGYREIPAFNAGPYAQHWFEKTLPARVDGTPAAR